MLVILVVYVFLQNWRATLIPAVAVPVSLIGTFIAFPALGFSLNTLSLLGLVLAIGLVVDDAIVVVEAVEHHIEEGMSPRDATIRAMDEVAGPVVSIALILASVFVPVAFMGGIQGSLNKQFAHHDRDLGAHLGVQRAHTLAGARRDVAAAAKGGTALRWSLPDLQPRLRQGLADLHRHQPRAHPEGCAGHRDPRGFRAASAGALGRTLPTSFLPEEDYGYFLLNVQLPTGRVAAAH